MAGESRSRTRLRPEVRREQIVEAADQVFHGRDPGEVTFEEIALAAGVSRGLVYNYFGDKQGLMAAVYLRTLQRLDDALNAEVDGTESPSELLLKVVEGYLRFARAQSRGFAYLVSSASANLHPDVRQARKTRVEEVALRWGGGHDALLVGHGVVGLLEAVTLRWLERGADDVEETAELVARLLWSGLAGLAPVTE
jgi:AcrR family transcriptional regulator